MGNFEIACHKEIREYMHFYLNMEKYVALFCVHFNINITNIKYNEIYIKYTVCYNSYINVSRKFCKSHNSGGL